MIAAQKRRGGNKKTSLMKSGFDAVQMTQYTITTTLLTLTSAELVQYARSRTNLSISCGLRKRYKEVSYKRRTYVIPEFLFSEQGMSQRGIAARYRLPMYRSYTVKSVEIVTGAEALLMGRFLFFFFLAILDSGNR